MVTIQSQVWGLETDLHIFPLAGHGIIPGKGDILLMKAKPRTTQTMARKAFGLLLELREREDAHQLLTQAIAFLEMLGREKEVNAAPFMLSVRVMQLRKS
jgi:hypothetical protein